MKYGLLSSLSYSLIYLPNESVEVQRVIRMGKKYSQENANTTLYVEPYLHQDNLKFLWNLFNPTSRRKKTPPEHILKLRSKAVVDKKITKYRQKTDGAQHHSYHAEATFHQ